MEKNDIYIFIYRIKNKMIITKSVKINITNSNIQNYKNVLNNLNIKNGEIEIPVEKLSKGSHIKILVKCDICDKERNIPYRQYLSSINNGDYYCCSSNCSKNKNVQTNIEKYGVEYTFQSDEIKEKIKNTCVERYDVDYYLKSKDKREKSEITCLEKYKTKIYVNSIDFKEKQKNTLQSNYGVENPSQSEEIKNKKIETCLKNYGVEYSFQSEEIKEKIKITCIERYNGIGLASTIIKEKAKITNLEKYNCEYVFQNEDVKDKKKKTCLEKYGTEYYVQSLIHKQVYIDKYFKEYGVLPSERKLEFKYYRSKVKNLTNKLKKELLKNWNGYDFYDGEYIKENFNLHNSDKNYPTIDHKISVFYGFNNNISPEEISKMENLCITKRSLNSIKNKKCYEEKNKNQYSFYCR